MEKIKIPQYLVRGKHRDFHVLCFPKLEHAWAYDEFDYQRYEIDGGYETYLWLKYAMAALIASPDKSFTFRFGKHLAGIFCPVTMPYLHAWNCNSAEVSGYGSAANWTRPTGLRTTVSSIIKTSYVML